MPRTFVIGDIHGCHRALVRLLDKITPAPDDTLIFLGDYIDRGLESQQAVSTILSLAAHYPHLIALMGNHEEMLLQYLAGRDQDLFLVSGGQETLESYGIINFSDIWTQTILPPAHLRFFESLLNFWEDDQFIYVHAGLKPGVPLPEQPPEWLRWSREEFISSDYDFGKQVIYGHTPWRSPRVEANKIGIDTGAVYGGHLTCLVLPDLKFVSVEGG